MAVLFTETSKAISVVINFTPRVIPTSHPNFAKISEMLRKPKTTEAQITKLLDIPAAINKFVGGNVTIANGRLFYKGFEVKGALATKILQLVKNKESEAARPFELFLENAYENPDPRAVTDLYDWVVHSELPITPDGMILAWKAVGDDYYSIHSGPRGKLRHMIGDVVSEPRNECNADPGQTCSRGIHFCSASYLSNYAGGGYRVIAVKINPRDVVAFPRDYGWAKGRCAELTVVGEVPFDQVKVFYPQGRAVYKGFSSSIAAKPKTPRTAAGFAVGQVWADRNGRTSTIVNTNSPAGRPDYPLQTGIGYYTESGRYVSDDEQNDRDLVRLVTDVQ